MRARSLRTGQTHRLAFVVADINSPVFGIMADAADQRAYVDGYSLVLFNTHDDLEREQFSIDSILQRAVDGVMFVSARDQSTALARLESFDIPMVVVDRVPSDYHGAAVVVDNDRAGRLAAEHLWALGHRRLAHIGGPGDTHIARERLEGYRTALEGLGIESLAIEQADDWHLGSGYEAMRKLLSGGAGFTAVYCAGDQLAIGAMRALREAGFGIPAEVSVVGTDDIDYDCYLDPPLTTVRQPLDEMATKGIEMLLQMLSGQQPDQLRHVVRCELIVRKSTAPAAAPRTAASKRRPKA
jgi:DNA-binding LacI/PurR family transcriptional regulator